MTPIKSKPSSVLPARPAMQQLAASQRTIADYAKATPLNAAAPTPNVLQNLRVR